MTLTLEDIQDMVISENIKSHLGGGLTLHYGVNHMPQKTIPTIKLKV